ncbi:unnamed protein product [Cunninghamella echinulata]
MTETSNKHSAIFIQPKSVTTISTNEDNIEKDQWLPLEDLNESDIDNEDGDIIIEQRLLVNNENALQRLAEDIKLKDYPLIETMSFTSTKPIVLYDVFDDLERENAFEQQALEAARMARKVCKEANVPFVNRDELRNQNVSTVKENNKKQKNQEAERIKLLKRKRKDADGDDTVIDDDIDMEDYQDNSLKSQKGMKILLRKKNRMMNNANGFDKSRDQGKGNSGSKKSNKKSFRPGKAKRQAMRNKK